MRIACYLSLDGTYGILFLEILIFEIVFPVKLESGASLLRCNLDCKKSITEKKAQT